MPSTIFQDKKERTDFFIAITVVALFGAFIGYYMLGDTSDEDLSLDTILAEPDVTTTVATIPSTAFTTNTEAGSRNRQNRSNHVEEYEVALITKSIDSSDLSQAHVLSDQSAIIDSTNLHEAVPEIKDEIKDEVKKMESLLEEKSNSIATQSTPSIANPAPSPAPNSVSPTSSAATTEVVENIVEGKDCRIIVGSYRLKSSRDKMLERLAETEYQVVTYREKGLYIVAIHHSCDKTELNSSIKVIRKNFAKGAFSPRK